MEALGAERLQFPDRHAGAAQVLDREIRLAVPPDFELPDLASLPEGLRAAGAERLRLLADYYDAADLRMARSGATLRHRSDEGWTFKLPRAEPARP